MTHRYAIHLVPAGDKTTMVGVLAYGGPLDLDDLRRYATVGGDGYVEVVPTDGCDVYVDEDGRRRGGERNAFASRLAKRDLVGPALVCTRTTDGDTVGLTHETLGLILSMFGIDVEDHDLPI